MKGPGVLKSAKSDITVSSPIHQHPNIQLGAQELLMEVASDLTGQRVSTKFVHRATFVESVSP